MEELEEFQKSQSRRIQEVQTTLFHSMVKYKKGGGSEKIFRG
jgi:hypothetical protein